VKEKQLVFSTGKINVEGQKDLDKDSGIA